MNSQKFLDGLLTYFDFLMRVRTRYRIEMQCKCKMKLLPENIITPLSEYASYNN